MSLFKRKDYNFIKLLFKALEIRQGKPNGTSMYECFDEAINGKREPYKIEIPKEAMMKLKLNSMYGMIVHDKILDEIHKEILRYDDVLNLPIYDYRKELKDMFEGQQLEYVGTDSVLTQWQKLPDYLLTLTVQEFQEVISDGLANGFEFRLQGSTIEYREVQS